MNILITGGAGFIGSHLTKFHLSKNDDVTVIDNFVTGNRMNIPPANNLKIIEADITNYNFSNLPTFDIVYDLASPASPKDFKNLSLEILKTNSIGLINLLDFFVKSNSGTFVFSSTSEIYGDPLEHPQKETYFGNVNSVGLRSCYDESKRFAEALMMAYFRKYKKDIRIARIFNTYGPFMKKNDGRVVSNLVNQAIDNQPLTIYGNGKQTRSLCYVSDMVEGLYSLAMTENISGEIINIGNPNEKTILEIADIIKKLVGSKSEIVFKEIGADDPKRRCPDITKAKKILSWEPKVALEEGLLKTINYFSKI
ncbi:NAD-dependent dehydratase [Candidatus Roizmanbacteria bacterium CG06_land_8_20_14_3_00_34_14]|uniref:UDP-glucuronate decarboxylase n=3 Tax=Candidatus Roizmaniibacteriota TaxID=1752723 RepID=A0A2M7AU55_9BACT|nr:MAG: NAD-dependent dehydratase [Candidatus Roizmanbacteria bacterium CG07_land_8_20_14_0_80_34_15]PIU74164.1 MAG: NAD-dependent dehydratase [Candidatus Roizmanbacteria bacterium CG06_land_8_20_14_3_00_34_14]